MRSTPSSLVHDRAGGRARLGSGGARHVTRQPSVDTLERARVVELAVAAAAAPRTLDRDDALLDGSDGERRVRGDARQHAVSPLLLEKRAPRLPHGADPLQVRQRRVPACEQPLVGPTVQLLAPVRQLGGELRGARRDVAAAQQAPRHELLHERGGHEHGAREGGALHELGARDEQDAAGVEVGLDRARLQARLAAVDDGERALGQRGGRGQRRGEGGLRAVDEAHHPPRRLGRVLLDEISDGGGGVDDGPVGVACRHSVHHDVLEARQPLSLRHGVRRERRVLVEVLAGACLLAAAAHLLGGHEDGVQGARRAIGALLEEGAGACSRRASSRAIASGTYSASVPEADSTTAVPSGSSRARLIRSRTDSIAPG
eukprot:scaffold34082_cov62-Phaeocystis_antarctica.AAC.7